VNKIDCTSRVQREFPPFPEAERFEVRNVPYSAWLFPRSGGLPLASQTTRSWILREFQQKAGIPAAQGWADTYQSRKRLINEEKREMLFCVFRAPINQDDLCSASIKWTAASKSCTDRLFRLAENPQLLPARM